LKHALLVFVILSCTPVSGQILFNLNKLSGPGNDYINTCAVDSKGNTYLSFGLGWATGSWNEIYQIFGKDYDSNQKGNLIKLDKNGSIVWMKSFGSEIKAISFDRDDNLFIAARHQQYSLMVAKVSPQGNVLWSITEGTSAGFGNMDILTDENGNSYVTGSVSSWTLFGLTLRQQGCCSSPHDFLVKFDASGARKWVIASAPDNYTAGKKLNFDKEGNIVLAGEFRYSMNLGGYSLSNDIGYLNPYIARISPNNGSVLGLTGLGGAAGHASFNDFKVDQDGSLFFTGEFTGAATFGNRVFQSKGGYDLFLGKMSKEGILEWVITSGTNGLDKGDRIQISGDDLYVSGIFSDNVNLDGAQIGNITGPTGFVSSFKKQSGRASWIKGYGNHPTDGGLIDPYHILLMDVRRLRIFGSFYGQISGFDNTFSSRSRDLFTGQVLDTVYSSPGASLRGKVFHSENGNCDPAQKGLKSIIVKAEPGPVYGLTDQFGNYQLRLPLGSYTLSQIIPQKLGQSMEQVCPPTKAAVDILSFSDVTPLINFGNSVIKKPHLRVDVAGQFRRCFSGQVVVEYCNEGLADATNVSLTVNFPEYVIPLKSSIPWSTKTGRQLIFKIPSVMAGACHKIFIRDSVICGNERIRGLTQCVTSSISPGNVTSTYPNWDRSEMTLSSKCLDNGFVRLVLKNIGSGPMRDSADFVIHANDILAYRHRYKLRSKDSLTLQVAANGKTIRMEAFSTPQSPRSSVSIVIEGCGASSITSLSTGFVNAFPQSDNEPELETFCSTIADSFDPNDKQVVPAGLTSEHRIAGTEELEYFIRFQNTGTAVAYDVIVRDKLDPSLDLSTLQVGVASHSFSFQIEGIGQPELVWRFKNIMLPDSSSNEPGSHGFIKFKIKPRESLPRGTVIKNAAAIFFDFNSAIITNEVFNTIGLPQVTPANVVVIQDCQENVTVNAGPDQNLIVCDKTSVMVNNVPPSQGLGFWTLIQGSATISRSFANMLSVEKLSAGINKLRYLVTHCENQDSSNLTIDRVTTPKVPTLNSSNIFCVDQSESATVMVTGERVNWYSDAAATNKIKAGSSYASNKSVTVYATDQNKGCESPPTPVVIQLKTRPSAPATMPSVVCLDTPITLKAEGSQLSWYMNIEDNQPFYTGDFYETRFASKGDQIIYVSQTKEGCESKKSALNIKVKQFDKASDFMMTVVTPNGDDFNDYFYIPNENFELCLGRFKQVTIIDRNGSRVFSSNRSDFKWDASGLPSGTYFYSITFGETQSRGFISVLR
jgi:gliding motility-associated-like protein